MRNVFVGGPRGFGVGLFAKQGTQTLSKVFIATPASAAAVVDGVPTSGGIVLHGTAVASATGGTIFDKGVPAVALTDHASLAVHDGTISVLTNDGVRVEGASRFTLDGGTITGGGPNCGLDATGIAVHDAAQATLKQGGDLINVPGFGIVADGTGKVTVTGSTISRDATAGCKGRPSVRLSGSATLTTTDATIESTGGQNVDGIVSDDSVTLSLVRTTVGGFTGKAIDVNRDEHLTIQGGSIDHNGAGIDERIPSDGTGVVHSPHIKLTNATLSGNGIGAQLEQPIFKMRGTRVDSNGTGIEVIGPVGGAAVGDDCFFACVNLGFEGDPGNNQFTANSDTGLRFRPNDGTTPSAIVADGNVWNPNTQGSDGSGRYTTPLLLRGVVPDPRNSGRNFALPNGSNTLIDLAGNPITLTAGSRVTRGGKTVSARLAFALSRSLAGKRLRLAVQATDRHGHTQVEPDAGSIHVAK